MFLTLLFSTTIDKSFKEKFENQLQNMQSIRSTNLGTTINDVTDQIKIKIPNSKFLSEQKLSMPLNFDIDQTNDFIDRIDISDLPSSIDNPPTLNNMADIIKIIKQFNGKVKKVFWDFDDTLHNKTEGISQDKIDILKEIKQMGVENHILTTRGQITHFAKKIHDNIIYADHIQAELQTSKAIEYIDTINYATAIPKGIYLHLLQNLPPKLEKDYVSLNNLKENEIVLHIDDNLEEIINVIYFAGKNVIPILYQQE